MAWLALVCGVASCHSSSHGPAKHDAGVDAPPPSCSHDAGTKKTNGTSCGCDADCASGFCVDNVCCNSACTENCKSCKTVSAPGTCSFIAAGDPPRMPALCPKSDLTTCGLDGTCDGKGGCRSYVAGTVCQPGTCDGASIGGIRVCDGNGSCTPGPATICAPFNCDSKTNSCVVNCSSDSDCAATVKCVNGSCGKRPIGAVCTAANQCASGFCADGFCCNVTCTGPCVSCNQSGRIGTCWPTAMGVADPHKICTATDKSTCGQTGACDGLGGCAKYAAETVCTPPACSGDRLNTAGTCNGLGTCRPQGVQACVPYRCSGSACVSHCASDADCITGHTCVNGSCGPKALGQPCSAGSECGSGFCADGVCCATACTGSCRSCALSTSLGTCAPVPMGAGDPHGVCVDKHASSCSTDGTCDGSGGCHKYPSGTECAPEKCASGVYTPVSTCDANGNCRAPDAIGCAPYVCNGARCYGACGNDMACSSGNVCAQGSCGLKPNGSFCSTGTECKSGQCAQGVCCATACSGSCFSCSMTGTMGLCTAVPTGLPDPAGLCTDKGPTSCGTDGKCQAGACQKYPQGTACKNASCPMPGSTFTAGGTCDGAGTCTVPAAASCFPFACGTNACRSTCATDGDCAPPATCNAGSCGLKPNGAVCQAGTECQSTVCAQGVCCATTCAGKCLSCALPGSPGTCSPVAAGGADPTGQCTDQGAASCGTTGFCNGSGGCAVYPAGTQCAAPACATTTMANLARTCDGGGNCKPPAMQSCAPFACNNATQSCVSVCTADADCAPGQFCTNGSCGLKRLGQICSLGSECASGNCVDGVCCSSASCDSCQVCNLTGNAGTCGPVALGAAEPHQRCVAAPPCGFDGTCNGAGACRNTSAGTSCGAASCTGAMSTAAGVCDGSGSCAQTAIPCPGHLQCGATACLTTCANNGDCVTGYTCQSGICTNLKPLGTTCALGTECLSGMCTEGVCCGSPSCGACASCNVTGKAGTCTALPPGTVVPASMCPDMGSASCGTNGTCDGTGHCATYPAGTTCAPAACMSGTALLVATSKCDGSGTCVAGATTDCTPQACAGAACTSGCATAADCAPGYSCAAPGDAGADGGALQCRL
ncbi:MAG TPA: hypothetical protein VHM31_19560 [Polyangia bacterium]|nr:hypothetical protein [Polyangia bacterium]